MSAAATNFMQCQAELAELNAAFPEKFGQAKYLLEEDIKLLAARLIEGV